MKAAALRAVRKVAASKAPQMVVVDAARAVRVYGGNAAVDKPHRGLVDNAGSLDNACRWLAAVQWMRGRPGGSIWIVDRDAARAAAGAFNSWRAIPADTGVHAHG